MSVHINRREFLAGTTAAAFALASAPHADASAPKVEIPLPHWRGFNLPPFFGTWNNGVPVEEEFALIAELGFNFVRLPMWYTHWTDPADWRNVKEETLQNIDKAVVYGRKHGLHVSLNFHRAPGYCVAPEPAEPFDLFKDQEALDAFCYHWELFAKRYAAAPANELSFNLVNEPVAKREDYDRVVRAAVGCIRAVSPDRIIIADGLGWGRQPMPEFTGLGIAQGTRGYDPMQISHYKASWVEGADKYPEPTWPITHKGKTVYDREKLEKLYAPWAALAAEGVRVHCGEMGCFNQTPHEVLLAWLGDVLGVLSAHNIGYALWEFRGAFGVLDSQRNDVQYEDWRGHKLDRKLLELLKAH